MFKKFYGYVSSKLSGATDSKRKSTVLIMVFGLIFLLSAGVFLLSPKRPPKAKPPTPVEAVVMKAPKTSADLEDLNRKLNGEKQERLGDTKQRQLAEETTQRKLSDLDKRLEAIGTKPGVSDEQLEKLIRSRVDSKVTELANTGQINGPRSIAPGVPSLGGALPGTPGSSATSSVPLLPREEGGASPADAVTSASSKPVRKPMRAVTEAMPSSTTGTATAPSVSSSASNPANTSGGAASDTNTNAPSSGVAVSNAVRAATGSAGLSSNASTRDVTPVALAAGRAQSEASFFIPIGTIITGVALTGIDAPTNQAGQKNPIPMLIRIKHDAVLPNRFRADLRECYILASGYGSLSSQRAKLRTNALSCIRNDGKVVEASVSGYIVGDDGREGIEGRVVSKTGDMIRNTLMAGFLQAGAQRLGGSGTSGTAVLGATPIGAAAGATGLTDLLASGGESGLLGGAGQAIGAIGKLYAEMAKEAWPVVEITPGRPLTIIVTNGFTLRFGNR